jgi:peptidoglycan/LPS O-acetylase OafA/YrhL
MFGFLRTTLALMVMAYHLHLSPMPLGDYAVFGFYIISGYLMTLIMHESYSYTWIGRLSFAINRFLRLYPQYWAAAAFSLLLIATLGPKRVMDYHGAIFLPYSALQTLQNFFMAFAAWRPDSLYPRLVPATWALTVEIFFYALIALGISKTFPRVKIWLGISIGYVIGTYVAGWSFQERYFPLGAASLPFSIGAAIYFISKIQPVNQLYRRMGISSLHLFILFLANCLLWMRIHSFVEVGFYLNVMIFSFLVYSIVTGSEILKLDRKVDKWIGDFSYPIYLLHWQSGLLVSYVMFGESFHKVSFHSIRSLIVSIPFVFILSFISICAIDRPIERIRTRIKANRALRRSIVTGPAELLSSANS